MFLHISNPLRKKFLLCLTSQNGWMVTLADEDLHYFPYYLFCKGPISVVKRGLLGNRVFLRVTSASEPVILFLRCHSDQAGDGRRSDS